MSDPKHIIFCGTPDFAVPSLLALLDDPAFSVDLVVTQPDKPAGRKQTLTPSPVKVIAQEHDIPLAQPKDINNFQFSIFNFQFLIVVAYGQLLKQPLLDLPAVASVNVHASLLPRWRGASPIQHAILAGDSVTGVTIQRMVRELDAGAVLAQQSMPLDPRETAPHLHDTLADMGAQLLVETLKQPLTPVEQDEANATTCKKLTRTDGNVDPSTMTAEEIDRRVRALVPWPGVTCPVNATTVKLHETSLEFTPGAIPLQCAEETTLYILQLQSPGAQVTDAAAWLRGQRPKQP